MNPYTPSRFLGDLYGGLTAAVVALPLALAFGVASGAGAIAGMYGAIAVGFFAAVFGGTKTQISGPTGPMTVVMAVIIAAHADSPADVFAIVMLGGLFQILFGLLRLGQYVSYTPFSVVSGFMSGIGVIIILIQALPFLGHAAPSGPPVASVLALPGALADLNLHALILGAITLAIMVFWPARWQTRLPAPLLALTVCTALGHFVLTQAPTIGHVPTGLPALHLPNPAGVLGYIQPALTLALLGSIDSLLTSLVADSITRTRHRSNKELIGQGIGNVVAGLLGGLPGAGATMRTVINVRAGGNSPVSGALHALVLLAVVLGLGPLAGTIPLAVLAGILLKVGWDIIDWGYLKRVHKAPRDKVFVMFVTLGLTVFVDLITAVAVGLILAGFVTARWMEREELKGVQVRALQRGKAPAAAPAAPVAVEGEAFGAGDLGQETLDGYGDRVGVISFSGRFSYASSRQIVHNAQASLLDYDLIVFDFSNVDHLDTSSAIAIDELLDSAQGRARGCFVYRLAGEPRRILASLGVLDGLPPTAFVDTEEQLERIGRDLLDGDAAAGPATNPA